MSDSETNSERVPPTSQPLRVCTICGTEFLAETSDATTLCSTHEDLL